MRENIYEYKINTNDNNNPKMYNHTIYIMSLTNVEIRNFQEEE